MKVGKGYFFCFRSIRKFAANLFYFAIAFIYRFAPAIKEKWKMFSPGTILATGLMILVTFAFSFWVNKFGTYNKVYGSIGTIMILMIVIYINSMILLIGYELNVSIHSLKLKTNHPPSSPTSG